MMIVDIERSETSFEHHELWNSIVKNLSGRWSYVGKLLNWLPWNI